MTSPYGQWPGNPEPPRPQPGPPYGPPSPYTRHEPQQQYYQGQPPRPQEQYYQDPRYGQYPPPGYSQHEAPRKSRRTLIWSLSGGAVALVVVVAAAVVALQSGGNSQTRPTSSPAQKPAAPATSLADADPKSLLALMPTSADFPEGTKTKIGVDKPGEGNTVDAFKPWPDEATDPPGCGNHLMGALNRDDTPDITRVVRSIGTDDQGQLIGIAQLAKENNGVDAIAKTKAWLAKCPQYELTQQNVNGDYRNRLEAEPITGPPGFSDPLIAFRLDETTPDGGGGASSYMAARVRGLLVITQTFCNRQKCSQDEEAQRKQIIQLQLTKIVQGLRSMP